MSNEGTTEKVVLDVEGMSCGHCVGKVEDALKAVEGVDGVKVGLDPGRATVEGENLAVQSLTQAVNDAGYESSVSTSS